MKTGLPRSVRRWVGIWLPFVDALEAGLWLFWVTDTEVIVTPRPALRILNDRLHCASGPAVSWPNGGAAYWFWRGLRVPAWIIEKPVAELTRDEVLGVDNVEVQRALIERIGDEAFVAICQPMVIHEDTSGTGHRRRLLSIDLPRDPDRAYRAVEVVCPSTGRRYLLRVAPTVRTCAEAVAASFGLRSSEEYRPLVET